MVLIIQPATFSSMLTIVPTPIGNLKDITLRALEVLKEADGIICEDTRRSSQLLNYYQIQKPLLILNDFNEATQVNQIMDKLRTGQNLALISDAGTPLISDPGYKLVRQALAEGIEIDSLPGPSSVTTALTLSGLSPDKFTFLGYLPEKPGHRQETYKKLKDLNSIMGITFIIFISPHKLLRTLEEMRENLGDIEITLAKELTKIYQKVETKPISRWLTELKGQPKGEYVVLFRLST